MSKRGSSKGRQRQTLRDYTRDLPSEKDRVRFREAMNSPSDLDSAIIQAIEVEYVLESFIISRLYRQDKATIDILCQDNGALGTFFAKIGIGYAMGLFNTETMEYLNTIRRIRNAFAHSRKEISFSTPLIRLELATIKLPANNTSKMFKSIELVRDLATIEGPPEGPPEGALSLAGRGAYVILCMSQMENLHEQHGLPSSRTQPQKEVIQDSE